jgi:2-polyprenyl-6-methoxyphenol hydroxylase-like FAD-dependent oxidoreductase
MVHYPIAGGKSFNMAVTIDNGARAEAIGVPVTRDEVRETFADARAEIRMILDRGRDWRSWVLCDRDPVATWTDGPVVLLGGAAHPML